MSTFGTLAPAYWERGFSVIPLKPNSKLPAISKWTGYCDNQPKEETRRQWLNGFCLSGIGLCCGTEVESGYRLMAIDIDDERLVKPARGLVGATLCAKRGKKGLTIFARAPKGDKLKSTQLQSPEKKGVIDVLISGKQTVLPPSIHPDTGAPYDWISASLLEIEFSSLPIFDERKLELLKYLVGSEEAWQIATGKSTHNPTLALVGSLVARRAPDEEITAIVRGLLPDGYSGNTLDELPGMIESARRKGFAHAELMPRDEAVAMEVEGELQPLVYFEGGGFLRYANGLWKPVSDNAIDRLAKAFLRPLLGPKSQVTPYLKNVRRCLSLDVEAENFGQNKGLICVRNGTIDVRTGELLPHSPEHQLRFKLDIDYDANAECPIYDEHVRQTLRQDGEAVDLFDEFAGLSLVPDMRFQKAVYLLGPGGSGKSTLLSMLEAIHDPEAISVTPLDKIDDERYRTDLALKLVCLSSDVQTHRKIFGETFVRITGGDALATRKLYAEVEGHVRPTVRFIGSMNLDMPPYIGAPDALERRLIFLPCGAKIEEPDPGRRERLLAERPGILLRWIKAYRRLVERGHFVIPESSRQEVSAYLHAHQPFDVFFEEELIVDPAAKTPVSRIAAGYNLWADNHGERQLTTNVVGLKLRRLGVQPGYGKRQEGDSEVTTRTVGVRLRDGTKAALRQWMKDQI